MLLLLFIILLHHLSLSSSLPTVPLPLPATIQPSLLPPPTTIPALPAQTDDATSSCPLILPTDLLHPLSLACSSSTPSRSQCCPTLTATLYSAYAGAALSAARTMPGGGGYELPVLPDDSETCVAEAEEALRRRGAEMGRVNATCGVAYCYCGVRLRRLQCGGEFVEVDGMWVPREDVGRQLRRECGVAGMAGCGRCLRALNKLKATPVTNVTRAGQKAGTGTTGGNMDCKLMGLTWLLSVNQTRYLRSATGVIRTFMEDADSEGSSSQPASCSLSSDNLPVAVSSDQINVNSSSEAVRLPLYILFPYCLLFLIVGAIF